MNSQHNAGMPKDAAKNFEGCTDHHRGHEAGHEILGETVIDPTSVIDPSAHIGQGVFVGAYSVIGANAHIGDGTQINPHVVIGNDTHIGKYCKIHEFASLGGRPNIRAPHTPGVLEIGDCNVIREHCVIHKGSLENGGTTRIGNDNYLMNHAHLGHDVLLGNGITVVSGAMIGGHVHIEDHATISGLVALHQRVRVGAYAFVARTRATKSIPPFSIANDMRARTSLSINAVGLMRHGFSRAQVRTINKALSLLKDRAISVVSLPQAMEALDPNDAHLKILSNFVRLPGERGLARS